MPTVTLDDVKTYLNITRTTNDAELSDFLSDAITIIERVIGPLASQSVTEEIDSHGPKIVLSRMPVLSVQSVSIEPWLGAAPVDDTAAWRLNTATGVLRRKVVGGSLPYYGPGSVFTVTYTAGRSDVPNDINRAILMQVADMWESQRGAMPLPAGGDSAPPSYGGDAGFLSADVMELLLPHLLPPGVA
jgi:uncharacterized phiE125 gp8 family phage protein